MKENVKNTFIFFLGNTPKKRFTRIVILLILIMLSLNLRIGCKEGKVFFEWMPAAEIKVNVGNK